MPRRKLDRVPVVMPVLGVCACGKPAFSRCGEGLGLQLILCREPVCSTDGRWCEGHRHRGGSMGYPVWSPVDVVYHGYEPDGPGFWGWVKARWKTLIRTPLQLAQMARDEQMQQFEKMAPVPDLTYHVGERTFANGRPNGRKMMEVTPAEPKESGANK